MRSRNPDHEPVARGGLLHRRALPAAGGLSLGAVGVTARESGGATALAWMRTQGAPLGGYGGRPPAAG